MRAAGAMARTASRMASDSADMSCSIASGRQASHDLIRQVGSAGGRRPPPLVRLAVRPQAALAAALAGDDVEVAAGHAARASRRSGPWSPARKSRPLVAEHEARRLPDDVELAVGLDFADQHRLGDVVVRHHRRDSRPVRFGTATPMMASITASGSVVPAFSTAFTHMLKPMYVRFHRVVGHALVVLDEGLPGLR